MENLDPSTNEKYAVGVCFETQECFYFLVTSKELFLVNTKVICESPRGVECGTVSKAPFLISATVAEALNFIIRIATENDLNTYHHNEEIGLEAKEYTQKTSAELNLVMHIIQAYFLFDQSKLIITYTSDIRVDFRELLKFLAYKYHTRIELRQVGPRDKAKVIGGIGICGQPLCCTTFLNQFDGISIAMAKNQMLTINIPKLSGQCGKLICCLKFEDEAYNDAKRELPLIGSKVKYQNETYTILSMNVLSQILKIGSSEKILFVKNAEVTPLLESPKSDEPNSNVGE